MIALALLIAAAEPVHVAACSDGIAVLAARIVDDRVEVLTKDGFDALAGNAVMATLVELPKLSWWQVGAGAPRAIGGRFASPQVVMRFSGDWRLVRIELGACKQSEEMFASAPLASESARRVAIADAERAALLQRHGSALANARVTTVATLASPSLRIVDIEHDGDIDIYTDKPIASSVVLEADAMRARVHRQRHEELRWVRLPNGRRMGLLRHHITPPTWGVLVVLAPGNGNGAVDMTSAAISPGGWH